MSNREKLAYAAGLFDGEGCVNYYFYENPPRICRGLSIANCDSRALFFAQKLFGGRVRRVATNRSNKRYHHGVWEIEGTSSEQVAVKLIPFSVIKREQLELYVEACADIRYGQKVTEEMWDERFKYIRRIATLKRPQLEGVF